MSVATPGAPGPPDGAPRPFARWLTIVGTLVVGSVFVAGIWVRHTSRTETAGGGSRPTTDTPGVGERRGLGHPVVRGLDAGGAAIGLVAAGILLARRRRPRPPPPELAAPWPPGALYGALVRSLLWSFLVVLLVGAVMVARKRQPSEAALTLVIYVVGFGAMVRLAFRRWGLSWRDSLARPPAAAAANVALTTLAAVGLCRAGSLVIGLLAWRLGTRVALTDLPPVIAAAARLELALSLAATVVMAPLTEELLFRRAIFASLRRRRGPRVAALASAVLFALPHGYAPVGLAMMTWMGLVTAWAFHRTGSLWPCVGAHAFSNAIAIWASVI